MIKEAKDYDLKVILDLHYSDTWADTKTQIVPSEWKDYTYNEVLDSIYTYTKDVLNTIKDNNLSIDYIQIGNEIDYGIISPFGYIDWDKRDESFDKVAEILSNGIKATREIFPSTKIIIHTANGLYRWVYEDTWGNAEMHFYEELEKRNLDYDIIGASFYTFENDVTPISYISDIIDNYKDKFDKEVMMVETSYAYTYEYNDYTSNIFYKDKELEEYPVSFEGQTKLILDLIEELASAKDNNGIGLCYWGGEWIPNTDSFMKSTWANQALFTYEGIATPTLSLFKECRP
nr:arabinogalactan endo-1,4-beta-galactosidase [Gammaproteobacteria bacterium]